jgi:hypothetical protein
MDNESLLSTGLDSPPLRLALVRSTMLNVVALARIAWPFLSVTTMDIVSPTVVASKSEMTDEAKRSESGEHSCDFRLKTSIVPQM